ncbi:hypothetical protein ES705_36878 [subsurface metagenome]
MVDTMIIIYDFNGYKDPKIKDVKLNRINGYKTVITREGEKKMEEYKLKNLSAKDAKRILEIADRENIDVEAIIDFIKKRKEVKKMTNNDEKTDNERFTEEEKTVQEFMAKPENKGISYRDAVIASLDRTEPLVKKEFTAEEIIEQENLKTVENYLDANPRASYSEACKILFQGKKPTLREKLIEEYLEKNPKADYREAVVESSSLLKEEPKKEE